MGRLYVGSAVISAPLVVAVAIALPAATLLMASLLQAVGQVLTAGTAIYCVRTGRIQQHRDWMMRSYPFATVFVFAKFFLAVPSY